MREIPVKNYIKLSLICLAVICLAVFSSIWYKKEITAKLNIPVIRGELPEITFNDLEEYLIEHEDAYLYVGVANDDNSRALEKKLISILNKHDIAQDTVYLNVTDVDNMSEFYRQFNEIHSEGQELSNYPAFIIIKDNKTYKLIQREENLLTDKDLDRFLGDNL